MKWKWYEQHMHKMTRTLPHAGMPQFWQQPGMGSAPPEHLMQARQMQMDPAMMQFYMQQQQQLAAAQQQTVPPPSTPGGPQEHPPQPDLVPSDSKPE